MYGKAIKFFIILPILFHLNLFDLLHPSHNFDSRENCPVCQFHSYQNNNDTCESEINNSELPILAEVVNNGEIVLYKNNNSKSNLIRGPPAIN